MKKSEITRIDLVHAGNGYSKAYRASYNRYRVIVRSPLGDNAIEWLFTPEELKSLAYWSPRGKTMSMTCWGTSQSFEAQIALGRWLGISEKGDWSGFCNKIEEIIKIV